ncbi:hypothetical protein F0U63_16715 [Cystobacter fuscus]|nr:hypothetical protein F0U63_16715 [Cystobacter fuscus]
MSPLLGMSILGATTYFQTPAQRRSILPWQLQPWTWGFAMLLVLCVALKDSLLGLVPFLKKPLDAAELVENKVSGAMALPLVSKSVATALALPLAAVMEEATRLAFPTAHAAGSTNLVGNELAAAAVYGLALTLSAGAFVVVWLTSHAVNVLVLLSPFAMLGAVLKLVRLLLLGFPMLCAAISPVLGLLVCAVYIFLAWRLAGWSFRLMVFGWVFSMDLLLLRWRRQQVDDASVLAFVAESLEGVPVRTCGVLSRSGTGGVNFTFRPWLVLPSRTVQLAESALNLEVGRGLLGPVMVQVDGSTRQVRSLVRLPPRYRTLEAKVAGAFGALPVRELSAARGLAAAWRFLQEQFGRKRQRRGEVEFSPGVAS